MHFHFAMQVKDISRSPTNPFGSDVRGHFRGCVRNSEGGKLPSVLLLLVTPPCQELIRLLASSLILHPHRLSTDTTSTPICNVCAQNGAVIPRDWPSLTVEAGEAFNLTSFALSLLLVFRTNESYSRWLDARKAWSGILIRSRDFVRQVLQGLSYLLYELSLTCH